MERDRAIEILERLHSAQNKFYAGGSGAMLKQLLTADISWTVPGNNRIAGTYRGLEEVFAYFRRRRDLADQTFQMDSARRARRHGATSRRLDRRRRHHRRQRAPLVNCRLTRFAKT